MRKPHLARPLLHLVQTRLAQRGLMRGAESPYPRTFQIDAVVGQNDSPSSPSHFIALNLNGRIEVIDFPGGDVSKARIYTGPQLYGAGQDLIPVTLSFADVNGNHHPDMIIRFQDTRIVYVNDHGGFRPATSTELQTVEQYLKRHGQ